jgi:mono/diheme cytochrome c family protein
VLAALVICSSVAACDQNMTSQPKYAEYEPAKLFRNGQVLQAPVAGTIARDDLAFAEEIATRPPLAPQLLERGRDRFDVICSPCHGRLADGEGIVVSRGMPHPPSFHNDRLRNEADDHFFDVMTKGFGVMYSYASRVQPRDRWAIVAYIRALQLSQHAAVDDIPEPQRSKLSEKRP